MSRLNGSPPAQRLRPRYLFGGWRVILPRASTWFDQATVPLVHGVIVSSGYLTLTTITTGALGYAYWILAARLFPAYVVGLVAALVAGMMLVTTLGSMGLGLGIAYILPGIGARWSGVVNGVLLAVSLAAAALAAALAFGSVALRLELGMVAGSPQALAAFVATCALWTVGFVLDQILTAERTANLVLVRNSIASLVRLALLPAAAWLALSGADAAVALFAVWGLSALLSTAVAAALLARSNPRVRRLGTDVSVRAVGDVLPLALTNHLLTTIVVTPPLILPLLVAHVVSVEHTAYFYTAWMVAQLLFTIPYATGTTLFAQGAANQALVQRSANGVAALTFGVVLPAAAGIVVARDLVLSVFGQIYAAEGSTLLAALAGSALPLCVFHIYVGVKRVRREFASALIICGIGSALTLAGALVAGSRFGLAGIGASYLGAVTIMAALGAADLWLPRLRLPRMLAVRGQQPAPRL
ncbi:MAG: hypothetical protein GEU73_14975 [Chloroflexi bacterium]|nr:hypothetical protein [Chloroflexota bacterium]